MHRAIEPAGPVFHALRAEQVHAIEPQEDRRESRAGKPGGRPIRRSGSRWGCESDASRRRWLTSDVLSRQQSPHTAQFDSGRNGPVC